MCPQDEPQAATDSFIGKSQPVSLSCSMSPSCYNFPSPGRTGGQLNREESASEFKLQSISFIVSITISSPGRTGGQLHREEPACEFELHGFAIAPHLLQVQRRVGQTRIPHHSGEARRQHEIRRRHFSYRNYSTTGTVHGISKLKGQETETYIVR